MSYEYRKGRIKFRREKRARLFTIAIIPETIGEPYREYFGRRKHPVSITKPNGGDIFLAVNSRVFPHR